MTGTVEASQVGVSTTARDVFTAYGLEIEYVLVAQDTLDVLPIADEALVRAGAAPGSGEVTHGAIGWSNELARHVVEVKNPAPCGLAELTGRFQSEVARFNGLLTPLGARLMPAGMHPWMDPVSETQLWAGANAPVYDAYDRIFNCHTHGWANVQSTHINLPFADDAQFARLHAAVRIVLPLIPALAASSPYVEGCAAGPLDYRMAVYRHNAASVPSLTGAVIPDPVRSRAEYEAAVLQPMYRDIAAHDPAGVLQHEWLDARGAVARFSRHAIEIRVMDVQECPLADVALAALVIDLVRALYEERFATLACQQAVPGAALSRILLACIEHAEQATIDEPEYLKIFGVQRAEVEAGALWWRIAERVHAKGARHHGLWTVPVELVLTRGTLARRLLDTLGTAPTRADLRKVYGDLAQCLVAGRMFDP